MSADRIRALNDRFRTTLEGGRVVMTSGVQALGPLMVAAAVQETRAFTAFPEDNDPHGEHDFGAFEIDGQKFFWKIDYYNSDLTAGSEDPADPEATTRILTLMLAAEY